jgi:hypothetical protein
MFLPKKFLNKVVSSKAVKEKAVSSSETIPVPHNFLLDSSLFKRNNSGANDKEMDEPHTPLSRSSSHGSKN